MAEYKEEDVIDRFKGFLRIPSISGNGPDGVYRAAVDYLSSVCTELGLGKPTVLSFVENKPLLLLEMLGRDTSLPSILLSGHYDVVPVVASKWDTDPFGATEIDGKIFGRGSQDMKCVVMQYLEALARVRRESLDRSIYCLLVPDEEIGGNDGVGEFIKSQHFKRLNVGVVLDEGLANPNDGFTVFYGERAVWWLSIFAEGNTGHGSRFIHDTAIEKLIYVLNEACCFREQQRAKLEYGCSHSSALKLGDVTTLNITYLESGVKSESSLGGYAINVIPDVAKCGIDIRLPVTTKIEDMIGVLDLWTAKEGVSYKFHQYTDQHCVSSIDSKTNPYWRTLTTVLDNLHYRYEPEVFPAATDSRFYRKEGITAFGFSPMNNTPILLHDHNEYIDRTVFLNGIEVFVQILLEFGNLEKFEY